MLLLGALSLIGPLTGIGIPLILAGPIAWILGGRARRQMAEEPGRWSGRDETKIGYILGIISTVILLLILGLITTGIIIDATDG